MKYPELLEIVGPSPILDSSMLRAGEADAASLSTQLSRWSSTGKLIPLRRGVYAIPEPYRQRAPEAFEVANLLVRPSYVSLESALSFHGLINEAVFAVTSVTSARPGRYETGLGDFLYRHVDPRLFWGYRLTSLGPQATAFVAMPEKALLDLVYLRPHGDSFGFLRELRLERLDQLDLERLEDCAQRFSKPKIERAAHRIATLAAGQAEEYVTL